jgi:hypothetical protein
MYCAFVNSAERAKAQSINQDFLPTIAFFLYFNEIAATSVDNRKLSR